jgi:hypothetical protein
LKVSCSVQKDFPDRQAIGPYVDLVEVFGIDPETILELDLGGVVSFITLATLARSWDVTYRIVPKYLDSLAPFLKIIE